MSDHDVRSAHVSAIEAAGVHPRTVDEFVQLRDHDVSADLIRLRDHDVSLDFIAKLKAHGYHPSIEDLIRLRDWGF